MKKRSIAARLGVAALALTLVTTSLSSGTLAKYIDTFSGTATLTVAGWNVGAKLDGTAMATGTPITVNLAKTVTGIQTNTVAGAGTEDSRLAPGMESTFDVEVTNQAESTGLVTEVAVDYFIFMKPVGTAPDNFLFWDESVNAGGADPSSMMQFDSESVDDENDSGTGLGWIVARGVLLPGDNAQKKTVTIGWRWPYQTVTAGDSVEESLKQQDKDTQNKEDTTNGLPQDNAKPLQLGGKAVDYEVNVVMVQHNPSVAIPASPSDPDTGVQWSR